MNRSMFKVMGMFIGVIAVMTVFMSCVRTVKGEPEPVAPTATVTVTAPATPGGKK